MVKPNPNAVDQKVQSVLYLMDKLTGSGIDGIKGEKTIMALRSAGNAMGMGSMADKGDMVKIEQALKDKLKDPKFRDAALEKLSQVDPPTKDSISATQTVLAAAGHTIPRDPVTGLVSGKMDGATSFALAHTVGGMPDKEAYASVLPESAVNVALNGGKSATQFAQGKDAIMVSPSAMNTSFQNAASGTSPSTEPAVSFENKARAPAGQAFTNG